MKIFKRSVICVLALSAILSCGDKEDQSITLDPIPTADFTSANPTNKSTNYVAFSDKSSGQSHILWDFGNGTTSVKKADTAYYAFPGTYNVTLYAFSSGGRSTPKVLPVTINQIDTALCNNKNLTYLTGGCATNSGKTWVFDPSGTVKSVESPDTSYTNTLADLPACMQDEEYTFLLNNYKFTTNTKGFTFGTVKEKADTCIKQEKAIDEGTFQFATAGEKKSLTLSGTLTMAFDDDKGEYEVFKLTENQLVIRKLCCSGLGYTYYYFVPKQQ